MYLFYLHFLLWTAADQRSGYNRCILLHLLWFLPSGAHSNIFHRNDIDPEEKSYTQPFWTKLTLQRESVYEVNLNPAAHKNDVTSRVPCDNSAPVWQIYLNMSALS